MPSLKNPKEERFCQEFVRGPNAGNATKAYKAAGYAGDRRDASKLRRRSDICRRIDELVGQVSQIEATATERALDALAITKERVLGELAKIGFANMLDYVRPTEDGDVVVDLSRLDRDRAAAVQEVVVDTYVDGRGGDAKEVKRVRFKLADKRAALVDLGKYLGLFVERRHVTVEHADKSDAELRGELAALVGQLRDLGVDLRAAGGDFIESEGTQAPGLPH